LFQTEGEMNSLRKPSETTSLANIETSLPLEDLKPTLAQALAILSGKTSMATRHAMICLKRALSSMALLKDMMAEEPDLLNELMMAVSAFVDHTSISLRHLASSALVLPALLGLEPAVSKSRTVAFATTVPLAEDLLNYKLLVSVLETIGTTLTDEECQLIQKKVYDAIKRFKNRTYYCVWGAEALYHLGVRKETLDPEIGKELEVHSTRRNNWSPWLSDEVKKHFWG
jgi:hypothetical protein